MRRKISFLVMLFIFLMGLQPVNASVDSIVVKRPITIIISFYDNIEQEHIIENTKISLTNESSILDTMQFLKEKEFIKDYSLENNNIKQVVFLDDSMKQVESKPFPTEFTVKQNGNYVSQALDTTLLHDGDIIEWIYSTKTSNESMNQLASGLSLAKDGNKHWGDKTNDALNQATNWLHLNSNNNQSYLISMGIAGRTADIKAVNDLVDNIKKKTEYNTPMELSKDIMALTFCGYDASVEEYKNLIKQLSNYENIMEVGVFGAINTLIAYDTNQYQLPIGVVNTREKLVANMLEFQQEDGGFSITKTSSSDIDTTAMAITALSRYQENQNVEVAIPKALEFLSQQQTATGGFGFQGQENLESLSTVIIALNSLNIALDDARFQKTNQSLVEQLLSYQNSDGGFAHIKGEKSAAMPTEQAMIALTSIKRNGNPYVLSVPITMGKGHPTSQVAIVKDNAFVFLLLGSTLLIIAAFAMIITRIYLAKRK